MTHVFKNPLLIYPQAVADEGFRESRGMKKGGDKVKIKFLILLVVILFSACGSDPQGKCIIERTENGATIRETYDSYEDYLQHCQALQRAHKYYDEVCERNCL